MRRLLIGLAFLTSIASATVHYKLTPLPSSQSILVSIDVDSMKPTETFHIPGWSPGYYQMARYEQNVYDVRATDAAGHELKIEQPDNRSWQVATKGAQNVTFSYKVLGNDPGLGFFAVNVGGDKAYLNGAAAFMYVEDRLTENVDLQIQNPSGWDVATAMTPADNFTFVAGGYDEFIDNPIQLGKFTRKKFSISGIPFEVIFVEPTNAPRCDMDAETERLRVVSIPALKMFGGASFKKYLYILHLEIGNFAGGLEHRACNVQAVANGSELHLDDLAAHEYFHAWNVKQIRPKILGPFDYSQPQRTGNLWFAEGVTDYYAKLHTYQSGLRDEAWLRGEINDQIGQLQQSQVRKSKTVEDSSRGTWEADGFGVGDLSFYVKGLLSGFIFDAAIIDATGGKKTLDDVMRLLYSRCKLPKPGYDEDELRLAINTVAGKDLSELYRKMIRSTEEMPYEQLAKIGMKVTLDDRSGHGPSGSSVSYNLDVDPAASAQAKTYYGIWLHRLHGVE